RFKCDWSSDVCSSDLTEEVIARIWSELLGVERIGRHDNFFALGGHSLLLAKMQVRLSQAGLSLSIPRIFANPTIASLLQNDGNRSEERRVGKGCSGV